jgi:hypothetical protein
VDPIKLIIFLACFVLLLVIGRMLASASEVHAAKLPHLPPQPSGASGPVDAGDDTAKSQPALTGAEIDFPIRLPPLVLQADGRYNRPNVLNYYFGKIDLVRGPEDPSCFLDEFFLKLQDPGSKHVWTYDCTVATPSGIQRVMNDEKFASLYFAGNVVVVPRWDLALVLHTVIEEIMNVYSGKDSAAEDIAKPGAAPGE